MNAPARKLAVDEINRLHDEVTRSAEASQILLHAAVLAAWQAGKLLIEEQTGVRDTMGAAWGQWLERYFQGTARTAQNYMTLAHGVCDVSQLKGLSLRQVYLRLGISTEPKSRGKHVPVPPLPTHIRLANRLLFALEPCVTSALKNPGQLQACRQDLRALYDRLRPLFES